METVESLVTKLQDAQGRIKRLESCIVTAVDLASPEDFDLDDVIRYLSRQVPVQPDELRTVASVFTMMPFRARKPLFDGIEVAEIMNCGHGWYNLFSSDGTLLQSLRSNKKITVRWTGVVTNG